MDNIDLFPTAPRHELMELITSQAAKRLVYFQAPAGFGKSFSMRLWLKRKQNSAWLALSEDAGRR